MKNNVSYDRIWILVILVFSFLIGFIAQSRETLYVILILGLLAILDICARLESNRRSKEVEIMETGFMEFTDDEDDEDCTSIWDRVNFMLSKNGVADLWDEEIKKLRKAEIHSADLFLEYRKVVLRLYDEVDMYYSEELDSCSMSKLLWQMEESPYSFRKFCKALGK